MSQTKNLQNNDADTQSLGTDDVVGAEVDTLEEPTWLRNTLDQNASAVSDLEPAWLRQAKPAALTVEASPRLEQCFSINTEGFQAKDDLMRSLRKRLRESGPAPSESSPELTLVTETTSPRGRNTSLGLVIVFCLSGIIALIPVVGWFGFMNNPLWASALPTPTPLLAASLQMVWPPTWTPTPTVAATTTKMSTPTIVPTETRTPKPTRVPPTRTPRPPSPTSSPYVYSSILRGCQHSGGTYIEGTVNSLYGEVVGAHVSLGGSPGGNVIQTFVTGRDKSPGYYTFVIRADGPALGTFYVWVTDTAGNPLSDPTRGRVTTNSIKNGDDPASCWQAFVDFVAVR